MTGTDLLNGVRSFTHVEDAGPFAILKHEVDLDDLLLELARRQGREDPWWNDEPTRLSSTWANSREADVRWWRKQPCQCGDDHNWDLSPTSYTDKPTGNDRYGAFLGVLVQ